MKWLLACLALSLACLATFGQSSCTPEPNITLDGGNNSTGDASVICTQIGYAGGSVSPVSADGPAPEAAGGTITDGTYRLTNYTLYNEPLASGSQDDIQGSIKFDSGNYEVTFMADGAEDNESGTYSVSGAMLTLSRSCPSVDAGEPRRYSISGSIFQLYDVSQDSATAEVEIGTYMLE